MIYNKYKIIITCESKFSTNYFGSQNLVINVGDQS